MLNPSKKEREALRELGSRVAEIAALPIQREKTELWKSLNGLRPERPMVIIDQVCWHEMEVDGELELKSEDEFCRSIETELRRTLYKWKHMPVDMVVEPVVRVQKVIKGLSFGIETIEETKATDEKNDVFSHHYIDQLKNEEDVQKIRDPEISLDVETTAQRESVAKEIFDGVLDVQLQGPELRFSPWDSIVTWRDPENTLMDLALRPDFMHMIVSRLTEVNLSMLDQLENQGLLETDQPTVHCTGAYSRELPAEGYNPQKSRPKDIWTFGMAQIFAEVSPAMHQEFELDYAEEWHSRFGLVYYGCCEPLHRKIDIVRKIPNLRKISMSPWVDQDDGAKQIGGDFVFSRKPSPAFLAGDHWAPKEIEADLRQTVEICGRHGCPLELILKDISTVNYQPQRLWKWAEIAMKTVGGKNGNS